MASWVHDYISEKEAKRLSGGGNIIIAEKPEDIANYVRNYANTNLKKMIYLGKIGKSLAERIKKDTGIDLEGYNVAITNAFENFHNNPEKEEPRGQIAITPELVELVPEIISEYDTVTKTINKNKQVELKFEKNIDGKKTVIEYVSSGRHYIYLQTMYGQKNKTRTMRGNDEESSKLKTPKAYMDKSFSNLNIPSVPENASVQGEKDIEKHSVAVDSEGRTLTKEQQKYFADSKIRDEQGSLY
ncbi:MAG: hypothetical protein K6B67_05910 [Lachnospiraceae bacterium]|nr:hypothetical protein [Lachnospiraceae bacterium]